MARPKSYRDLIVWQKAMSLAQLTYVMSQKLPKTESYGLLSQIRRAAVSIPSNIAEGHGRLSDAQFRYFLGNARGSLYELQTQFELAGNLGYLETKPVQEWMEHGAEVARLLNGLIASIGQGKQNTNQSANSANSANHANSTSKDHQ